ncbi:MAG: 2Fe-2S iron-sulfur cluster-binding protein [Pseudomonadota bacterium]
MSQAFADITFTPAVKAAQTRYGSREANRWAETSNQRKDRLTTRERSFIERRDGFYQATVNEDGWPYVQFRGGPAGFLRVIDDATLGFADFRGNTQYLSVGNLTANDRIALILMDYPNRRRLKLWGRTRIVDADEDPALMARLAVPSYDARIERALLITVDAYDWNCPQHITPRFSEAELAEVLAPITVRVDELADENRRLRDRGGPPSEALGDGPLQLLVSGVRQLTPRVRAYELRSVDGSALPTVGAGAHLPVPVRLADGMLDVRTYSIASDPARGDAYEIAVLREDAGRGGSVALHRDYQLGQVVNAGLPVEGYALHEDDRPAVLMAGGIGITPLKAMAHALHANGRAFRLHYSARSANDLAYAEELRTLAGDAVTFHTSDDVRLDVPAALAAAPAHAMFYVCGPERLIEAVTAAAAEQNLDPERVRFERFTAPTSRPGDVPLEVELTDSGRTLQIGADQTILEAMLDAGIDQPFSCRTGTCGTCAVRVVEGEPDHRDTALSPAERARGRFCTCVSRAKGPRLVLDA